MLKFSNLVLPVSAVNGCCGIIQLATWLYNVAAFLIQLFSPLTGNSKHAASYAEQAEGRRTAPA